MKLKRTSVSGYKANNKGASKKRNIQKYAFYAMNPMYTKMVVKSKLEDNEKEVVEKANKIQKIVIKTAIIIVIIAVIALIASAAWDALQITYNGERIK